MYFLKNITILISTPSLQLINEKTRLCSTGQNIHIKFVNKKKKKSRKYSNNKEITNFYKLYKLTFHSTQKDIFTIFSQQIIND